MNKALAIFELMRLDKPIGIYLLLWPALLALVISTNGDFEYADLLIVIAGSILVRSAGCVINDIWDKDLDGGVERTKTCLLYTSPSPRDQRGSRMPSSA